MNENKIGLDYQPDWKEEYQKALDLHCLTLDELREANFEIKRLKTAPPQRTWVGLTNEEKQQCIYDEQSYVLDYEDCVDKTEAKLKEKNT